MKETEPSIRGLRLFTTMAEENGLLRAAERLGISQSGASHALAVLEKSMGVRLAVRNAGNLQLSEAGRRLLPHAQRMLASLDAMRDEVLGLTGLTKGTLRIAAVPSLASTILPRLIREFAGRYPGIEVTLFEGTDNEVADWVATRMLQIGFAALPVADVDGLEIARDEWLALVPKEEFAGQEKVSLGVLSRRKFLLSGGGCEVHIRRLFQDAGLELPVHLTVKQMSTIHAMVAEGLGVSVVPELAIQYAPRSVRAIRLSPRRFRRIGLLTPKDGLRTAAMEAWISLVQGKELLTAGVPVRPGLRVRS